MAHTRKVTKEGRVNIPVEYMQAFNINFEDLVDVTITETAILIKKHVEKGYCVITKKVYPIEQLKRIGDVYISYEGLALIKEYI